MKHLFTLLTIILFFPIIVRAQVTIGSSISPNKGALLDLKEYNLANSVTASRGLALPRVELTSMTDLYPMFKEDLDYIANKDGKKDTEDALHTALTVYNIYTDYCNEIYPGIYTWNGTTWTPLHIGVFKGEVDILVDDRDPNRVEKYQIGKFGNAGWWMLENLRATIWPKNSTEGADVGDLVLEMPVHASIDPNNHKPTYYYPKADATDLVTNPHHGYMYNMYAALRITEENFQDKSFKLTGRQGICPDGWRLPTFDDWSRLAFSIEKNGGIEDGEIYLNPCKYAHSDINVNTGFNMMSMENSPNGKSRTTEQGGFNANLLGRITSAAGVNQVGTYAYFWLGFRHETLAGGFTGALFHTLNAAAYYQPMERRTQVSVRCVKND